MLRENVDTVWRTFEAYERGWFAYTLDGGKIVRLDMCVDEAQALEAVGLSE
jgi:ketosteroid isomerase-like protein